MSEQHTPETDSEVYMVQCTSVQNYGIEDPSEVVDATFSRKLERQRDELLEALEQIAMAAEATHCNIEWVAKRAKRAIAKVEGGGV